MEIPLKPEFESMIRERVGTGQYVTAASVVEEGLRLLAQKEVHVREHKAPYLTATDNTGDQANCFGAFGSESSGIRARSMS